MKFCLHPQAQEELEQTILFYQKQQIGLEKRFIEALENADYCIFLMRLFLEPNRLS